MNVKDIKGYIRNVARQNSGAYLFVLTSDEQAFGKIQAMADEGFVADSILYDKDTGTTKKALVSWNIGKGIFDGVDAKTFRVNEDNNISLKDNQGRKLSKEQQEFFKDSKVRDNDGKLPTMYHSTPQIFTEFDKSKLGENTGYNNTKFGFYLTPNKDYSSRFKGNSKGYTMELYANITKPITYPYNAHYKYSGQDLDNIVKNYLYATNNQDFYNDLLSFMEEDNYNSLYDAYMNTVMTDTEFQEGIEYEKETLE
jgi:hypothetical protein